MSYNERSTLEESSMSYYTKTTEHESSMAAAESDAAMYERALLSDETLPLDRLPGSTDRSMLTGGVEGGQADGYSSLGDEYERFKASMDSMFRSTNAEAANTVTTSSAVARVGYASGGDNRSSTPASDRSGRSGSGTEEEEAAPRATRSEDRSELENSSLSAPSGIPTKTLSAAATAPTLSNSSGEIPDDADAVISRDPISEGPSEPETRSRTPIPSLRIDADTDNVAPPVAESPREVLLRKRLQQVEQEKDDAIMQGREAIDVLARQLERQRSEKELVEEQGRDVAKILASELERREQEEADIVAQAQDVKEILFHELQSPGSASKHLQEENEALVRRIGDLQAENERLMTFVEQSQDELEKLRDAIDEMAKEQSAASAVAEDARFVQEKIAILEEEMQGNLKSAHAEIARLSSRNEELEQRLRVGEGTSAAELDRARSELEHSRAEFDAERNELLTRIERLERQAVEPPQPAPAASGSLGDLEAKLERRFRDFSERVAHTSAVDEEYRRRALENLTESEHIDKLHRDGVTRRDLAEMAVEIRARVKKEREASAQREQAVMLCGSLELEVERLQIQLAQVRDEKKEAEENSEAAHGEIEKIANDYNELRTSYGEMQRSVQSLESSAVALERERSARAEAEMRVSVLESELAGARGDLALSQQELEAKVAAVQRMENIFSAEVEPQVDRLQAQLAEATEEADALRSRNGELERRVSLLQMQLQRANEETRDAQQQQRVIPPPQVEGSSDDSVAFLRAKVAAQRRLIDSLLHDKARLRAVIAIGSAGSDGEDDEVAESEGESESDSE